MLVAFACAAVLALAGDPTDASEGESTASMPAEAQASNPDRPWIRYRLGRNERVEELAARYGVPLEEVEAVNGTIELHKGDLVELQPRQFTPPRASRTVKVGEKKRTWTEVAERWGVDEQDLRAWNQRFKRRKEKLPKGAVLTVWFDSGVARFPYVGKPQPMPKFEAKPGAYSIGKPHRGRIENAAQLPESDLYKIRFNRLAWGSTLTVESIQSAIAAFRRDSGFSGELYIGAMSRKSGRRLRPHRSHQSGRDLDIRMPAMSHTEGYKLDRTEIDWHATWVLVDSFIRTGNVKVIFLERKLFARLRSAGLRMGATDERMAEVMSKVRHSKGHTSHIHVRFVCSDEAERCVEQD